VSEHQNPARGAALCVVRPIHATPEAPGRGPGRGDGVRSCRFSDVSEHQNPARGGVITQSR